MLFGRVLMPSARCLWILDCGDCKGQSKGKNNPLQWYERPGHLTMLHGYGHDTMDKDGHVKTLPLFADINVRTPKYTFSHPGGLLFTTQFAQITLIITEKAAFEDLHVKGFVQKDCVFAGHSLGKYSALASIANVLHISALVDVVFYCGITMQCAVKHDSENRSNYVMCTINPSQVSSAFSDAALHEVVDSIATCTTSLLEIINYNVEVSLFDHEVARFLINQSTRVNNMFVQRDYDECLELFESSKD